MRPLICRAYARAAIARRHIESIWESLMIVVRGKSGAGKSTWIKKRFEPGDMVLEYDRLFAAVGTMDKEFKGCHDYGYSEEDRLEYIQLVLYLRNQTLRWLEGRPWLGEVYLVPTQHEVITCGPKVSRDVHLKAGAWQ
jgi:hypothetical protein